MLKITKLNKSYGATHVLHDISLEVAQGQVVAIIGPSGSGKSTLLRCVNLLETPQSGQMTIGSQRLDVASMSRADANQLRQQTAMVFQHYNLFKNKTALENITESLIIGKKMPRQQANAIGLALLDKVGLSLKADSYPSRLSGGQQQRVAIARALAVSPRVMLLDEPTSALDPELVNEVLQVIRAIIDHQTTILLVTHEMAFARDIADRIIFMDEGVILEDGTPEQVFGAPQHARTARFLQTVHQPTTPESGPGR